MHHEPELLLHNKTSSATQCLHIEFISVGAAPELKVQLDSLPTLGFQESFPLFFFSPFFLRRLMREGNWRMARQCSTIPFQTPDPSINLIRSSSLASISFISCSIAFSRLDCSWFRAKWVFYKPLQSPLCAFLSRSFAFSVLHQSGVAVPTRLSVCFPLNSMMLASCASVGAGCCRAQGLRCPVIWAEKLMGLAGSSQIQNRKP